MAFAQDLTTSYNASKIHKLDLEINSGQIEINSRKDGKVSIQVTKTRFDEKVCDLKVGERSGKISVETKKNLLTSGECEVKVLVYAPAEVKVEAAMGSGNIAITGPFKETELVSGSGDVLFSGLFEQLDVKVGSGDVRGTALEAGADIKTGSGDIDLNYKAIPSKGKLSIMKASGDLKIITPKDAKLKSDVTTASGKFLNEVGDTKDAGFEVSVTSASGNVNIEKQK